MKILSFTGGGFAENGYLVVCPSTREAVVVDPGAAAARMVAALAEEDATLVAVLLTHAHLDHVEGLPRVLEVADVPVYLHPDDRPLFRAAPQQAAAFGLDAPDLSAAESTVPFGETYVFGERTLQVRHTPGHAPGHVILWDEGAGAAFVGDVVFRGSIGRTDLPGGDYRELMRSIREEVLTLPGETRLLTGHGPETTVEWERTSNPFLVPQYGGELA